MAGRNLFATAGRDLFAEEPPEEQINMQIQPLTKESLSSGSSGGGLPDGLIGKATRQPIEGDTTIQDDRTVESEGVTFKEFIEPAVAIGSSLIAEPAAGIAGIVQSINPFADEGAGSEAVTATREALTYQPKTEKGQAALSEFGELLTPVAEFVGDIETSLGDAAYNETGSPALAAAAASLPTVLTEVLGVASGRGAIKSTNIVKNKLKDGQIARAVNEAAPTIEQLKSTSRAVYKEIDDMGVSVAANAFDKVVDDIAEAARKSGLDKDITPKAQKALMRLEELKGTDVPLSELEILREVAGGAAKSIDPHEAMLGVRMIEKIDDFLDSADGASLKIPAHIDKKNVGKRYKVARDMWGRARRSELIQESFEKARNQASGFENGIRTQFRAILNNKKKSRMFKPDELAAMKRVVRGDTKQNIAKLIGKLGFSEGAATGLIGGSIGVGAGAAVGGVPGAMIVPVVGQVSKKLAQRMTVKGAEFADQVIRAGSNAKKITAAYLKNTPKAQRSAQELSELLTRNDIDLIDMPDIPVVNEAARLATQRRAELTGIIAAQQLNNEQ